MARTESDREDLLREATAFAERVEWMVPHEPQPVLLGLATSGRFAVYFGQDPFYQFDSEGRLRRAFANGHLYRSQGTTLAQLTRVREEQKTTLHRVDLTERECRLFLDAMHQRLERLLDAIEIQNSQPLRIVGNWSDFGPRLLPRLRLAATRSELSPPISSR